MFEYPLGATPIDDDEAEGLLPGHLTTQTDLNEWEQANIAAAAAWIRTSRLDPFDHLAVRRLHERMFDQTWSWAGQFRTTEKTIGVAPEDIPVRLRDLLDDGRYWFERVTFPPRECALRLHHRLVFIHLFPIKGSHRFDQAIMALSHQTSIRQPGSLVARLGYPRPIGRSPGESSGAGG